jgi:hypothetical protein
VSGVHKAFPPWLGHVRIPISSREAAIASLAIYAPNRRVTTFLHRASLAYVKLLGPRMLPGPATVWQPPMEPDLWHDLVRQIEDLSGPMEDFGIYGRRQSTRSGFSLLLLRGGRATGFVRVNRDRHRRFRHEFAALQMIQREGPRGFKAPAPLGVGDAGGWSFLATSVLLPGRHRTPVGPPIRDIASFIQEALRGMPRPADIPSHWVPHHGDLTPFNLRDAGDGQLVLYDWEQVGWGPPGADEVLYRAAEGVLRKDRSAIREWPEARTYWEKRLSIPDYRDPAVKRYRRELLLRLRG